jgi:hypothetical protein
MMMLFMQFSYKPTEGLQLPPPLEADQITQPVDLRTVQSIGQTARAAETDQQEREETRNQMQQLQHTS